MIAELSQCTLNKTDFRQKGWLLYYLKHLKVVFNHRYICDPRGQVAR